MKEIIIKITAIFFILKHPIWTLIVLDKSQLTNCIKNEDFDIRVIYKGKPHISKIMIRNISDKICTDEDMLLSKVEYEAGYENPELLK